MIKFSLTCDQEHSFESWFQSSGAFEKLDNANMVSCPVCGSSDVKKSMMAPRVRTSRKKAVEPVIGKAPQAPAPEHTPQHALAEPSSDIEAAIKELREKVQKSSEYVGDDFAKEARRIHEGDAEERSIYGEAKPADAKKLIEDGVPVAPLPFMPTRKTN